MKTCFMEQPSGFLLRSEFDIGILKVSTKLLSLDAIHA